MDFFQAFILGIIEGITEFLPISSTGHLIIANHILNIPETEFVKSFDIIIQLGAILAVVVLYLKKILANLSTFKKVAVAFIPTAIIGFVLYPFIKSFLLGNIMIVAIALLVGGILMIALELYWRRRMRLENAITYKRAGLVGIFQTLAVIPGVSRSGATIIGGLILGIPREMIVEFSFLLAIPTMVAATGLDLMKTGFTFTPHEYLLLSVGFITSFVTALIAIKAFLNFIKNHTFIGFGIYRIIVGILILFFLI